MTNQQITSAVRQTPGISNYKLYAILGAGTIPEKVAQAQKAIDQACAEKSIIRYPGPRYYVPRSSMPAGEAQTIIEDEMEKFRRNAGGNLSFQEWKDRFIRHLEQSTHDL